MFLCLCGGKIPFKPTSGFDVTDRIDIEIGSHQAIDEAIQRHEEYIAAQTLADNIRLVKKLDESGSRIVELEDDVATRMKIRKVD